MSRYCRKCGAEIADNGMCPVCGEFYGEDEVYSSAPQNQEQPDFQPVDISGYTQQQSYAPEQGYPQQSYAPEQGYPQQSYAPEQGYPQQNYAPEQGYPQQSYVPEQGYPQQNYAPEQGYQQQNYAPEQGYQQQNYTPEQGASGNSKAEVPAILTEWASCVVKFFSKKPADAIDATLESKENSWILFAVLNVFFGALALSSIVGNGFNWLIDKIFGSFAFMTSFVEGYSFGELFVLFIVAFIAFAGLLCVSGLSLYVLATVEHKKVEFVPALQAASIAYFPMTIVCAAAFIFSFFMPTISLLLLVLGFIVSIMFFNTTAQKLIGSDEISFWGLAASNAVNVLAAFLLSYIAISIAL